MSAIEIIRLIALLLQILFLLISIGKMLVRKDLESSTSYLICSLICGAMVMILSIFK